MPELLSFLLIGVWIYCLIDIATSRREEARNLPKWAWFVLALLIPFIGIPLWFFFGRPPRARVRRAGPVPRESAPRPHLTRRSRPSRPDPADDEEAVRARIAERDALLARWAEEEQHRSPNDGQ